MNQRMAHALSTCLKAAGIVGSLQMSFFIIFRFGLNNALSHIVLVSFPFAIFVILYIAGFVIQRKYVKIDKEVFVALSRTRSNFCAECGTLVTPEANFCTHCGKQI